MAAAETQERPGTDLVQQAPGTRAPLALHNGVIAPDRWAMFGRMAHVIANTDFAPKGMRGKPDAIMGALMYGDSLGLHPSVSLTDIFIVEGKPGVSGALMLAKIREAGHKVTFKTLRADDGTFLGSTCIGKRIKVVKRGRSIVEEVEEEDEWTFTLEDAKRAGLYPNSSDKAAWMKYPEVMCRWRALAQLARFLFADVFRGQAIYTPDEAQEIAYADRIVNGSLSEAPPEDEEEKLDIEYGDEPMLALWLIELFQAANETVEGSYRPRKVQALLAGKTEAERREIASEVEKFIVRNGGTVPDDPADSTQVDPNESIEEAEFTAIGEDEREGEQESLPER